MGQSEEAVELARDSVQNVQTAAIEALTRAKQTGVIDPALDVLRQGADFQLMRAAANALYNLPAEKLNEATVALLGALRRLTELDEDPSRDPRLAIVAALTRVMRKDQGYSLLDFMNDVDDQVNGAVSKAFETVTGTFPPPPPPPYRRYPFQPTELALSALPREATIQLAEGGAVVIDLLQNEAPVTIARFAALVNAGYYNGLTFHRIVPNFVVQGGSPGANEYVGTARFMRDEVTAPHLRGAVGISTRGRDTGDAQIFIDLVDLPRLDREYTVFGYVISGLEHVDRMLEGAVIRAIRLR
jgi:cyclophilin family peptidyl-prolyl cis-trans isomerase